MRWMRKEIRSSSGGSGLFDLAIVSQLLFFADPCNCARTLAHARQTNKSAQ